MGTKEKDLVQSVFKGSNKGTFSDVTSPKKTELNLKVSEAKFKALLEAIPDMIFIQNSEGDFLDYYAPSTKKLLVLPEQIIGKNMSEVLPEEICEKMRVAQRETLRTNQVTQLEYTIRGKQGSEFYEARIVPLDSYSLLTIVRDITQKKANEQLLNIRNRALAAAGNGIIIVDAQKPDMPIIYCNRAFEKITGYKKEEVYGLNCRFLQRGDRDQEDIAAIRSAIHSGKPCKAVLRNYRKDGTMFWNELTITPVHNDAMKLTHFIGVQNDISYKKREEYFKDQIRKILEDITKKIPLESIGNRIAETVEIYLKNCMASILLLDRKNNTLHKLSAPNLPKIFCDRIDGITVGPEVCSCGSVAYTKKTAIVTDIKTDALWEKHRDIALKYGLKSCWSYPIISTNKEVLGTFTIYSKYPRKPANNEIDIILDMTYLASVAIVQHNNRVALRENEKQLEKYAQKLEEKVKERTQEVMATVQKLVESNLNLEDQIQITKRAESEAIAGKALSAAIAKNFPKGIITVVKDTFEILLAEGEALAELGFKDHIVEGLTIDDIATFSENRKTKLKNYVIRTLGGEHLYFEENYKSNYFSVNTTPLYDENNNATSALIVYSDISEQKKVEMDMQLALKKEQDLNELKSRFISMASHEFRTPLSVILSSTTLIERHNQLGRHDENKKYIKKIANNVNSLELILNDFLSLSKLDEGKIRASLKQFDLIDFSKVLVSEIEGVHAKKGQTITITSSHPSILVTLDSKLMRHILINLLSNATKYSPESTDIQLLLTNSKEKVSLEIVDRGIGIPEEDWENVFQRFFRAKNAANIEGTGIGLNIVKRYVELLHGTISFKSKVNTGTTFTVILPKNNVKNAS